MPYQRFKYPLGILGGISLALAWLMPDTTWCVFFGWLSCIIFILHLWIEDRIYYSFYLSGIISHFIAFYWLKDTIADFGGIPQPLSIGIFLFYCFAATIQFPLTVLAYRNLPSITEKLNIRIALAWLCIEILPLKIFPWQLGHTQLNFSTFAFTASWGGTLVIGFLMFVLAESFLKLVILRQRKKRFLGALSLFITCLAFNNYQINELKITEKTAPEINIDVVQANISVADKGNIKFFESNRLSYERLTQSILPAKQNTLIIWPETVITDFLPAENVYPAQIFKTFRSNGDEAFLVGSLTARSSSIYFNSALLVTDYTTPAQVYHKRILMPFGEYTPLAKSFPIIKAITPEIGEFSAGSEAKILIKNFAATGDTVKVAPLICYEDVIEYPAREASQLGANLLANLTNDAWFGNTAAPKQHNMIAAFRAIENQKYLIRSTNSGFTTAINPLGQTIAEIPVFSENILHAKVKLLDQQTVFTKLGKFPSWLLCSLALILIIFSKSKKILKKFKSHKNKK